MRSRCIFPSSIFCIWRPHYYPWAAANLCLCACGLLTICQHGWVGGTREGFSVDFSNQFRSQVCNPPSIFNRKVTPEISVWKLSCGVRECWGNLQGVTGKHHGWWAELNSMSLWNSRFKPVSGVGFIQPLSCHRRCLFLRCSPGKPRLWWSRCLGLCPADGRGTAVDVFSGCSPPSELGRKTEAWAWQR